MPVQLSVKGITIIITITISNAMRQSHCKFNFSALHRAGHNIVLGGSHTDEYILDYLRITPIATV
jgi:hypothetical protein